MDKNGVYENYFFNQYSNGTEVIKYLKDSYIYINKSIGDILPKDKNIKILDLGCGFGQFANYCYLMNYKNYIGVDLSEDELKIAKNNFKNYEFFKSDLFDFLYKSKDNQYDIIYMSMVFEHLTLQQGMELIPLIFDKLKKGGLFINYQPNADSYFHSAASLYIDITHERLYNKGSYMQLVKSLIGDKKYILTFRNSYIGRNFIGNTIHKIIKFFFEKFLLFMGYDKKEIYTKSFYSILEKKD